MPLLNLAYGPEFSVDLVYDDIAKTASVIQIDNSKGADIITFWALISGVKYEQIAKPGEMKEIPLPVGKWAYEELDLTSIGKPGRRGFKVTALDGYGIIRDTGKAIFERVV